MFNTLLITCIKKTNRSDPHERIHGVGGLGPDGKTFYLTLDDAIKGIESHVWTFQTSVDGKPAMVVIAIHNGHKYLKTEADGIQPNNLLSLPECP